MSMSRESVLCKERRFRYAVRGSNASIETVTRISQDHEFSSRRDFANRIDVLSARIVVIQAGDY